MPNTPVVVRDGVTIYSLGSKVRDGDKNLVDYLLSSVGVCHEMDEYYMDVITGLTGCGPSYVSCYSNTILHQQNVQYHMTRLEMDKANEITK